MSDQFTNDIPRDGWGRPKIKQPDGKLKAYRRTTKFINVLEDTYNLEKWKLRQVALGLGQREDLVLAAASCTQEDKGTLNDVAHKAMEHARSSSKSTTGTALHKLCERVDRGEPLGSIPSAFVGDIEAYEKCRDANGLKYKQIEMMRVLHDWQVAGTPDRVGEYQGKHYIIDVKTGDITWSEREISMQLGAYSRSTAYTADGDVDDGFVIDQDRAIVIHLPSGQGKCELHWVDIARGWKACQLAKQVWDWRSESGLFVPLSEDDPLIPLALACTTVEELRDLWQTAYEEDAIDDAFKVVVKQRLTELGAA